ncbi:hypothetical protein CMK11_00105 [Candidatus Poribacteria bacterium]|jgi:hypothetical protein|nr:hypothetical protein [Candidatus Poribacteria bacterium]
MAWEKRKGVGRYYTRSERVGGRVVRRYIGTGPLAELIAREDEARQREREAQRAAWSAEREAWDAIERRALDDSRKLDGVIRAHVVAEGFHQHKRGEWRRRRGQ